MKRKPKLGEAKKLLQKIGIPELFINEPSQLINTENMRLARSTTPEVIQETDIPEVVKDTTIDEYFGDEPSTTVIVIDLHNKMKNFIESEVLSLIDMGRKQIRKEKMYDQFLKHRM